MQITHGALGRRRKIGAIGTIARIAVGLAMVGSVGEGHLAGDFHPAPWLLGLIGFPAALLAWQWWHLRRSPDRRQVTGWRGHVVGLSIFLALYFTWWYAPALDVTSDAALLFYGGSMLLAAARGYAGCELFAVPNWLLGRQDTIDCALFNPVDRLERHGAPPSER